MSPLNPLSLGFASGCHSSGRVAPIDQAGSVPGRSMFVYVTGIAISPSFTWGFQWLLFFRQGTLPSTSSGRRQVSLRLSMLQTLLTSRQMSPLHLLSRGSSIRSAPTYSLHRQTRAQHLVFTMILTHLCLPPRAALTGPQLSRGSNYRERRARSQHHNTAPHIRSDSCPQTAQQL